MSSGLEALFEPKSVVLLGASELTGDNAMSAAFFRSLASNLSKFTKGKVHGVDISGKIGGYDKKLTGTNKGWDLALVSLPKNLLTKSLSSLLIRKTKAMVLISDGLDQKQREGFAAPAKKGRILLLGPRATMGVINTANGLVATPARGLAPKQGRIAVISQDGEFAASMLDWACSNGVGISKFACVGDGLGVDAVDLLQYLTADKETNVICIYIETVKDGRKFVEAIGEATKVKPVLVLKGGSDRNEIFGAALKQFGAFQVHNIEELFTVAEGLANQPPMLGSRVAVVTNVAGQARFLVRAIAEEGLALAELSDVTVKNISKKYHNVKISGFVNLGAQARADHYKFAVEQVLSDKNVDGLVVINSVKPTLLEPNDVRGVADAAKKSKDKPVVDLVPGGKDNIQVREVLAGSTLPVYNQPEKAARVMKFLSIRGKTLKTERK